MQKVNRPMIKLNINSKVAFTILGVQVTEYQMLCGRSVPVHFLLRSLSESILYWKPLYLVKFLIAALKNKKYICMCSWGHFFSIFVWFAYCLCAEWAPLCFRKNKWDFVFTLFYWCCEFYQSDRKGLIL